MTRRERRIAKLTLELMEIEAHKADHAFVAVPNDTERTFMEAAKSKGFSDVARNGWPDFMVRSPTGELIGVEVKSALDSLSVSQKTMFALLEESGLRVFVWYAPQPNVLIPWRNFKKDKANRLRRSIAKLKRSLERDGINL